MIKTLRITSIIAAILAGILFVFPVVFGVRGDEQVEQVLSSAGVIENFNKLTGHKVEDGDDRSSPLVRPESAQAESGSAGATRWYCFASGTGYG